MNFSTWVFGAYIWSAMGIAAVLMVLEPMALVFRRRSVIAQIKRNIRLEERRSNNEKN